LLRQEIGDRQLAFDSGNFPLAAPAILEVPQDDAELFELAYPSDDNSLADLKRRDDFCDDEFFDAQVQVGFEFI